jgi:hypothetical protein
MLTKTKRGVFATPHCPIFVPDIEQGQAFVEGSPGSERKLSKT